MSNRFLLFLLTLVLPPLLVAGSLTSPLDQDKQYLQQFLALSLPRRHPSDYNFSSPVCSWNGVTCSSSNQTRVTALLLEGLGLQGNLLSGTLGKLDSLTRFSLYNNSLAGTIPQDIWSLTRLSYLSLSHNKFSGQIPAQVALLLQMRRLDLSANCMTGAIPIQISQLVHLRYLYLSSNAFTGVIPSEISNCNSLVSIDLSTNKLSGTIPAGFGTLANLALLNLSNNALQGELPVDLSQMLRLKVLDLSSNSLSGPISSLEGLRMLDTLILSDNQFSGTVPLLMQLSILNLRNNRLAGSLPTSLSSQLMVLDLSRNYFRGMIPSQIGNLSSLEILDLSSNMLTGSILENLSHLPSLRHLSLAENGFALSPSPTIVGLHQIEFLNLSACHLVGPFPQSIVSLTSLKEIDLSYNNLDGSIPPDINNLQSLTYLDLCNNNLSGNVSFVVGLTQLKHLNLSFNKWIGCLPAELVTTFGPEAFTGSAPCQPLPANITMNNRAASKNSRIRLAALIGIVVSSVVALCGILVVVLICSSRRANWVATRKDPFKEEKYVSGPFSFETDSGTWVANVKNPGSVPVVMFEKPLLNLTFADLLQATSNFNNETQLSEGGFGPVYRALLPGGMHVAIKVLIEGRVLTDHEANGEFGVLSRIKHPNLVPLVGYCLVGDERLVIYEYMENGGLHRWLHDSPMGTNLDDWSKDTWEDGEGEEETSPSDEILNWPRRHTIALGTARALAFLHHGYSTQLVHRDVKASNVMLDSEFEPHLANTGLAGLLAASDESLFAGGTPGYIPPEYGQPSGKVTTRGDVYGFGVVLLELVTGKRPVGDFYEEGFAGNLVGWVRKLMKEKKGYRALDPRLVNTGPMTEMLEALRLGYLCTQDSPAKRPTMQQIMGLLKDMVPNSMTSP